MPVLRALYELQEWEEGKKRVRGGFEMVVALLTFGCTLWYIMKEKSASG